MAAQLIITGDPAVGYLLTPRVQHLQALLMPRLIVDLGRHVAFLAPLLVPHPLLGQGQTEVEHGMIVLRDVTHEHTDLAVVDLASVPAPLAFHPHRMRAALGKAARIEGDDAIGFAQPLGCLSN